MLDPRVLPAVIPPMAIAVDLLLGDPHRMPHPVRVIGWAANQLDAFGNHDGASPVFRRVMGALSVALLVAGSAATVGACLAFLPLEGLTALYFSYAGLALGQLLREGRRVLRLTADHDGLARKALAMLVSRDTSRLTLPDVRRALAETLGENASDGFVAPFFYLALLGPAGLWAYKAASTLDSMWGYKTERYRDFGWAAARLDDLLNWIPARLTAAGILLVAWGRGLLGGRAPRRLRTAWRLTVRDARTMASPNAGWPMAAAAWGLGAGMGGEAVYFGKVVQKPWLGPPAESDRQWTTARCVRLLDVLATACLLLALPLHLAGLALAEVVAMGWRLG